jgi:hypothetical protein
LVQELIKLGPQLKAVHARWSCCFLFQREVHALIPAVPLRMAGLDAPSLSHHTASFDRLLNKLG